MLRKSYEIYTRSQKQYRHHARDQYQIHVTKTSPRPHASNIIKSFLHSHQWHTISIWLPRDFRSLLKHPRPGHFLPGKRLKGRNSNMAHVVWGCCRYATGMWFSQHLSPGLYPVSTPAKCLRSLTEWAISRLTSFTSPRNLKCACPFVGGKGIGRLPHSFLQTKGNACSGGTSGASLEDVLAWPEDSEACPFYEYSGAISEMRHK